MRVDEAMGSVGFGWSFCGVRMLLEGLFTLLNMYRVLLKVDEVNIRIKETVEIHVQVRQGAKYFSHSRKQVLINGHVSIPNSSQFLIDARCPCFQLEIYLIMGEIKKRGGSVAIDLRRFSINTSHRITQTIQKSPLANSMMRIDFVYMLSDRIIPNESLVSLAQIQQEAHRKQLHLYAQENQLLQKDKNKLSQKIENLKNRNEQLEHEHKMVEEEAEAGERLYHREIRNMALINEQIAQNIQSQKQKIADIVDVINEHGNAQLIQKIQNIINPNQPQNPIELSIVSQQ